MAIKSKYLLMKDSSQSDEFGNKYPDLTTFPINEFTPQTKAIDYELSSNDCYRFFDLINSYYGSFDFYDDITLWLNDIEYISKEEDNFEKYIRLFQKKDLDRWFLSNV